MLALNGKIMGSHKGNEEARKHKEAGKLWKNSMPSLKYYTG
jgi:hypothetical protein